LPKRKAAAKKVRKKKPAKMGRPLKHTPAQAQKLIDGYFRDCDDTDTPYTISNLALALDTSRRGLCNWCERDDALSAVIKRAKWRVEAAVELLMLKAKNPAAMIFWLKNFGWSDRQELEVSGSFDVMERLRKGRDRANAERS